MMQARWPGYLKRMVIGSALGLTVLVAAGPTALYAQDEESSIWNLERRLWNGLMRGIGLRGPDDEVIEYRERSPLVVPPSRDLPPPQTTTAAKNPAWPVDPDISRQRKRAEAKRKAPIDTARAVDQQGAPISPDELNRGAGTPSGSGKSGTPGAIDSDGRALAPSELGYFGGLFSFRAFGFGGYQNETGTFTKEPPRDTLTAPPPGYQTPSPAQPYGVTRRVERSKAEQFDPGR